jgi:hypothetical protein
MDVGFEDMDREVGETPDYDYDEPHLWSDRYYSSDSIDYEITPKRLEGVYTINLILDGSYLLSPITQSDIGKTFVVSVSAQNSLASWRYTVRHASRLGYFLHRVFDNYAIAYKLYLLYADYGFTKDIYDCIFGVSTTYDLLYQFDPTVVYHDCDVWASLPRDKFVGYPYWSRVCYDRTLYTALYACSDFGNLLYAIHALVKGYEPDASIPDVCALLTGVPTETTVINIANTLIQYYYTPCGMVYTTDTSKTIISGIRTNLALILFTLLAYKYGLREYASYADNLANRVYDAVIKTPTILLSDGSTVLRPQHVGGEMVSWKCLSPQQGFYEIPETWIEAVASAILGWRKMPPEDADYGVTNAETTLTGIQALRVYLYYKYGIAYPNSSYLP